MHDQDFLEDTHQKNLQQLSLVYIEVQQYIEKLFDDGASLSPFSVTFIKDVHSQLYTKPQMKPFLKIKLDKDANTSIDMVAGKLRERNVAIAQHKAPLFNELPTLLNHYEYLYQIYPYHTQARKLIHAMASHHRLTWLHPFLDGNGRTSRLVLDGTLNAIKLEGYGLWNISRGLARDEVNYRKNLAMADMVKQGTFDGRGPLSAKGLKSHVHFMLSTALDQITFMHSSLRLDVLSVRMDKYIKLSREELLECDPLPKYSDLLLKELLLVGELPRGKVKEIIGTKDRTASTLIKELLELDYIESTTAKSPIRLKFNAFFASYLFPGLLPPV
ncbi:MAG: Cell filamentation protein Fic [uncultured Sulfurovum sp.]|uniref:Cell filamentation protein Fic n=1 Tax=uncultured Sulfurovum sp. TaxID=269237 RepID=A0A6S6TXF0_9BACT|nr:MAG: Cell filamentation protein Fic [uncultured Sulfurovum sp.]